MSLLTVRQVQKNYGDQVVIRDVDLHLEEGEIISLLGVSGVGKSTLFNVISGLYMPDQGSVHLRGGDITGEPGHISYMLQKDLLLPYKTILANAALPLIIRGEQTRAAEEKAAALFAEFGLAGTERKYPHQLSGGMRQRAALLRTYFASQGVMLLDEPFSALDTITKGSLHAWFLNLRRHVSLSAIFITHDIDEAVLLSDRVYIMAGKPGQIIREIRIETNGPRDYDFSFSAGFLDYKKEILAALAPSLESLPE